MYELVVFFFAQNPLNNYKISIIHYF